VWTFLIWIAVYVAIMGIIVNTLWLFWACRIVGRTDLHYDRAFVVNFVSLLASAAASLFVQWLFGFYLLSWITSFIVLLWVYCKMFDTIWGEAAVIAVIYQVLAFVAYAIGIGMFYLILPSVFPSFVKILQMIEPGFGHK